METVIRNPYDALRKCENVEEVDRLLNEIGLTEDTEKRLMFLYDVMGIKYTFCANNLTLEEAYTVAKEELVSQIWKEFN